MPSSRRLNSALTDFSSCTRRMASASRVEITGGPDKIDTFVQLMREVGLVEVGRTGIVGLMRGAGAS